MIGVGGLTVEAELGVRARNRQIVAGCAIIIIVAAFFYLFIYDGDTFTNSQYGISMHFSKEWRLSDSPFPDYLKVAYVPGKNASIYIQVFPKSEESRSFYERNSSEIASFIQNVQKMYSTKYTTENGLSYAGDFKGTVGSLGGRVSVNFEARLSDAETRADKTLLERYCVNGGYLFCLSGFYNTGDEAVRASIEKAFDSLRFTN